MQLVKYDDNKIKLNSMLDEAAFGKTRYEAVISQQGILFTCDKAENHNYHFAYKPFAFAEIKAETVEGFEEPRVFFCADCSGFDPDSRTLIDFFEQAGKPDASREDKDLMFEASFIVCSILTQCAKENIKVPRIGGGGIFIKVDGLNSQVLFLPETLFTSACAGLSRIEDANLNGCWINSTLYDLPSICFERSLIAYKMLTGRFPFPEVELDKRNADILDRKFLPLELSINGIDIDLAKEIDRSLKLTSSAVNIPGKKQKGKASEDLTPVPDFPLEKLYAVKSAKLEAKISEEEFQKKAASYEKSQKSKVSAKRAIRRNTTKIVIGAIVAVIGIIIGLNVHKSHMEEFTTTGLTSTQVIEGFCKGINDKDTILLQNFGSGKTPERVQKTVGQIYVLGKQRMTYDGDNGYANPQNWICYISDASKLSKSGLYGLTQLQIDGKKADLAIELKTRKDKPEPVTEEEGVTLKKGMKSVHQVEYFALHTEGEDNNIFVDYSKDTYTLTYKKDHWIITDIKTTNTKVEVNYSQFVTDYFTTYKMTENNPVRTVELLSGKYPWLPEASLVQKEMDDLKKAAEDFAASLG